MEQKPTTYLFSSGIQRVSHLENLAFSPWLLPANQGSPADWPLLTQPLTPLEAERWPIEWGSVLAAASQKQTLLTGWLWQFQKCFVLNWKKLVPYKALQLQNAHTQCIVAYGQVRERPSRKYAHTQQKKNTHLEHFFLLRIFCTFTLFFKTALHVPMCMCTSDNM